MSGLGVSVLTLVKNRHAHLLELIEGLRRCEPPPGELIVVAMDATPFTLPPAGFPIRTICHASSGLPLAAARNRAAAAASCPLLVFLDVDCIPMRGMLGSMAAHLAAHDALIGAAVHYLPADAIEHPWDEARMLSLAASHPARAFPDQGVVRAPQPGLFWSLAFGIRRERFIALGGFDERFEGYGAEDTDFAFRAASASVDHLFAGGPGVFHQHHPIFDPPLQHFHDILRNARVFHDIWGRWPMEGWLDRFADIGLIDRTPTSLILRRPPTTAEVLNARRADHVVF